MVEGHTYAQRVPAARSDTTTAEPLEPTEPAVCVIASGPLDALATTLRAVLRSIPDGTPVVVAEPKGIDAPLRELLDALDAPVERVSGGSLTAALDAALDSLAPADVAVVQGCAVHAGWLEGLARAARARDTTATAGALVAGDPRLPPNGLQPSQGDGAMRGATLRRHRDDGPPPRLSAPGSRCAYLRRQAIELTGKLDTSLTVASAMLDLGERCTQAGLGHVLAQDVLVDPIPPVQATGLEPALTARHPTLASRLETEHADAALTRAVARADAAIDGLAVTLDGRVLTRGAVSGTRVQTLELALALARLDGVRVRLLVPPDLDPVARERLDATPVKRLETEAAAGTAPTAVVHRPFQMTSAEDLVQLRHLGERLVITQQDLIGYDVPHYSPSPESWADYRRLTRDALLASDAVTFFSAHARAAAVEAGCVDPARAHVVRLGTDHVAPAASPCRPAGLDDDARPFLLVLGADYRHKNRVFAVRVLESLVEVHGWDGRLVLAGPHVAYGGSAGDEAALALAEPDLAARVHELGPVSEEDKAWLYRRATVVLYPTTYEGFGLVPFEAAAAGTPCAWAPVTALSEMLPVSAAVIVPWDAEATAARIAPLLVPGVAREAAIEAVQAAGRELTWKRTAEGTLAAYWAAMRAPLRLEQLAAQDALAADARRAHFEGLHAGLVDSIGPTGLSLVGPEGHLPPDVQRTLAALARRPATRRALFAFLTALRRRHRRRRSVA